MDQPRDVSQVVATPLSNELQDADVGGARPARLPARCFGGIPDVHHPPAAEDSVEDAVFSRRRSLGAEAAEQPPVVPDGERLGGRVDEAGKVEYLSQI